MRKSFLRFACLSAAALLPAAAAFAAPTFRSNPRVFNDFPTSTLTFTNPGTNPTSVVIDDRNLSNAGGGGFANRHDVLVSLDGNATNASFPISQGFTISTTLTLADGSNAPRKEAGIRINSPITGDALFIVNSDAGEIVAFGGGAQFFRFGQNSSGNGYTPGTPILIGETYVPGVGGAPGTLEYFINRGAGIESSGAQPFSNLEGGPLNFTLGVYAQVSPASANDFITATFSNLTVTGIVPEPASLGLISLGAFGALSRRRRYVKA